MSENRSTSSPPERPDRPSRRRKDVLDQSLLPPPRIMSEQERNSLRRLAYYEAWAWYQALWYWIPGHLGWIIRRLAYRPFFQRAGRGWHIAEFCSIQPPNRFQIGYRSVVSRFAVVNALGGVYLGDYSGLGPFSQVITQNHTFKNIPGVEWGAQPRIMETAPVIIEANVWVGAGSIILPGVRIGPYAIVAAGATVTRDVPPYSVVAGVPAKLVRRLDPEAEGFLVGRVARGQDEGEMPVD